MNKSLEQRVEEAVREEISIAPYDPAWLLQFEEEAKFLRRRLPSSLLGKIEHFGSIAIPGMAAKPIIDMLVEVTRSLSEKYPNDRIAYTRGKTEFVESVTVRAVRWRQSSELRLQA